jgi:transposase
LLAFKKRGIMSIDWDAIRTAWNRDYGTNFVTRKRFLKTLYDKDKSATKMGEKLCISNRVILNAMREDNLKILPKGHHFPTPAQRFMLSLNTKDMTMKEIEVATGFTGSHCWQLLKKLDLSWKRVR